MNELNVGTWTASWMWSLPLIVVTVLIHSFGLGFINKFVSRILTNLDKYCAARLVSLLVLEAAVLSVAVLHGTEGLIWAIVFRQLGALPEMKSAMLYSLSAMTTYGHANLYLEPQWQLMGALEALNGLILFGLTTAFLFTIVQKVWSNATWMDTIKTRTVTE